MALLTGISEAEILEVKQAEIHEKVRQSIHQAGWLPHLFRAIVGKARAFLQGLIRQRAMPPKPTLDIDMAEFRAMRGLMIRVRDEATSIRYLQEDVLPDLKQQLAAATGIFKTRERKDIWADTADRAGNQPQDGCASLHRPGGGLSRCADIYSHLPQGRGRCQPA